jgi:SAM-dependent methyltransferase
VGLGSAVLVRQRRIGEGAELVVFDGVARRRGERGRQRGCGEDRVESLGTHGVVALYRRLGDSQARDDGLVMSLLRSRRGGVPGPARAVGARAGSRAGRAERHGMDAVTSAVRAMYTAFPYPAGPPMLRQGTDARLLLSYGQMGRPAGRPVRVLDAGCGRGVGLVGAAVAQPEVDFTGVDVCERSLDDARAEVEKRALSNVRLAAVDLMTLEGLEVPAGGYDVVLSSGVLHHTVDPKAALARLRDVLAPHGVVSLMVYGRRGREPLYRLVRAVDALVPRDVPIEERLAVARELVAATDGATLRVGPWDDLATIGDAEFVDRYLNVHETSYDVAELFALVADAGFEFLRWCEPADWDTDRVLAAGPARERARGRSALERYAMVEELTWRSALELVIAKRGNGPRSRTLGADWRKEPLAWSPEATLCVERRNLASGTRIESVAVKVRRRAPLALGSAHATLALLLESQRESFLLGDLVNLAARHGIEAASARTAALDLVAHEALFRPHLADL